MLINTPNRTTSFFFISKMNISLFFIFLVLLEKTRESPLDNKEIFLKESNHEYLLVGLMLKLIFQ